MILIKISSKLSILSEKFSKLYRIINEYQDFNNCVYNCIFYIDTSFYNNVYNINSK